MPIEIMAPLPGNAPFAEFCATTVRSGEFTWLSGRDEVVLRRGDVVRYPTTMGMDPSWPSHDLALIRIPLEAVERMAQARFGITGAGLHFDGMTPLSRRLAARWRALTSLVQRAVSDPGAPLDQSLVHAQVIDRVAVVALAVFPNTTMEANQIAGPGAVAPPALRRAAGFIDANAANPITLTDIAAASGVTPRAVEHWFDLHYGTTPMAYLHRVRFDAVHRELQAADPTSGATVGGIATHWGFGNVGHFTHLYRRQFGVPPSDTLRT